MNEINKLKKALNFLTTHLAGASELAEIATEGSIVLETNHHNNPEDILIGKKNHNSKCLINDQKLRSDLGYSGRKVVVEKYGIRILSEKLVNVIHRTYL